MNDRGAESYFRLALTRVRGVARRRAAQAERRRSGMDRCCPRKGSRASPQTAQPAANILTFSPQPGHLFGALMSHSRHVKVEERIKIAEERSRACLRDEDPTGREALEGRQSASRRTRDASRTLGLRWPNRNHRETGGPNSTERTATRENGNQRCAGRRAVPHAPFADAGVIDHLDAGSPGSLLRRSRERSRPRTTGSTVQAPRRSRARR